MGEITPTGFRRKAGIRFALVVASTVALVLSGINLSHAAQANERLL